MILTIFDLETTGVDKLNDQIIQFAGIKFNTKTGEIIDSISQLIKPIGNYSIALGAYFKHNISPKILEDKPTLQEFAPTIIKFFNDSENILTYNGNGFDIPFLKIELNKYGYDIDFSLKKCYDAYLEEKRRNGMHLEDVYMRYKGKSMEDAGLVAHDALSDVKATLSIFIGQQGRQSYGPEKMYGEDNTIQDMIFLNELQPCFNIGKYRGISLKYVSEHDQNYLKWCISSKCNFLQSTKEYIKQYINE